MSSPGLTGMTPDAIAKFMSTEDDDDKAAVSDVTQIGYDGGKRRRRRKSRKKRRKSRKKRRKSRKSKKRKSRRRRRR